MIISLYAHGMSVRDILHHLRQVYGTELSPKTVSRITDQVLEEVKAWQSRPLDLPCLRGGVHFERSRSRKITPWLCGTRRI